MKTTLFSREITYGKKDVAELENASIKVQLIYDKTLFMLHSHLPDSLWDAWIGVPYSIISSLYKGNNDSGTIFQNGFKVLLAGNVSVVNGIAWSRRNLFKK